MQCGGLISNYCPASFVMKKRAIKKKRIFLLSYQCFQLLLLLVAFLYKLFILSTGFFTAWSIFNLWIVGTEASWWANMCFFPWFALFSVCFVFFLCWYSFLIIVFKSQFPCSTSIFRDVYKSPVWTSHGNCGEVHQSWIPLFIFLSFIVLICCISPKKIN